MNRRDAVFALLALGASPTSFAQRPDKVWRIGFLVPRRRPASLDADSLGAFPRAMRELGYVEGRNLAIDWRFGENNADRLLVLARELAGLNPDVIVTQATPAARAAQKATARIPIVMANVGDPVAAGLVKSLGRPEANITGLSNRSSDLGPKQFQLLLEIVPKASRIAVLMNPENPASALFLRQIRQAARQSGKEIVTANVRNLQEIAIAFADMAKARADAMILAGDPSLADQIRPIADLALKHRLPCMGPYRELAEAGCQASFGVGPDDDNYRRAAHYVDKILKGAKPGDLPVEQPTKFEFVINLKTAKAIGLAIPQTVLVRADRVIE